MMKTHKTELDGVLIIEPKVWSDKRGYFIETYQRPRYADVGISAEFVQDNLSFSKKGTLFVCSVILLCFITSAVIFMHRSAKLICQKPNRVARMLACRVLKDSKDDLVLELAVSSKCYSIITHNKKDFSRVQKHFGIQILTPKEFLKKIGSHPDEKKATTISLGKLDRLGRQTHTDAHGQGGVKG